jgi:bifunctional pyridoxal-dependent enzyme with beta-cystathionase and maltose regulon repressor activities
MPSKYVVWKCFLLYGIISWVSFRSIYRCFEVDCPLSRVVAGLILSSPSNPTGGMLSSDQLRELCEVCKKHGIVFISDEIYHGITYGTQKEATAVSFSDSVGNLELG